MSQKETSSAFELFDENATAVRGFPTVMRGYERKAVDDYIRELERQLASAKKQYREARRELTAANLRHDDTDFAKLGTYTASLLRAAESQAADLVTKAQHEADSVVAEAHAQAEAIQQERSRAADEQRVDGIEELNRLRKTLQAQTKAELDAAIAEAKSLREAAEKHRELVLTDASAQAAALVDSARAEAAREAARLIAEASEQAEQVRNSAAADRAAALADLAAEQTKLRDQLAEMAAATKARSEELQETITKTTEELRGRREAALSEAEKIRVDAVSESAAIISTAQAAADRHRAETEGELVKRSEVLQREQNLLRQRKEALLAQLANLSSVASLTALEFPDELTAESVVIETVADAADEASEESTDEKAKGKRK